MSFDKTDFIEDFFCDNPLSFILFLFIFFLFSVFIIFLLKFFANSKKTLKKTSEPVKLSLDELIKIAGNKKSTDEDLIFALNYFNENFRVKDFPSKSFEFFKLLLNHQNRNKKVFQIFHKESVRRNKDFEGELNRIEKEALR